MSNISYFSLSGLSVGLPTSVSSPSYSVQRLHSIARQHQEKVRSYAEDALVRQQQEKARSFAEDVIVRQQQEKARSYAEDVIVRQKQEKVRSYNDTTLNQCNDTMQVSPESVSGVEQRRIRYSNIGKCLYNIHCIQSWQAKGTMPTSFHTHAYGT